MSNGGRTATTGEVIVLKNRNNPSRRVQVHFWIHERDYEFLRAYAEQEDEPMSKILRRMVRQLRMKAGDIPSKTGTDSSSSSTVLSSVSPKNAVPNWYQRDCCP